jgi:two-component system, chemotaxis family, sensor kinase CheA
MDIDRAALMQAFLSDSEEDLGAMEQALLVLETRPDDVRALDTIFRKAHTLKGNAATLALDGFARLAHALEDVLHALRSRRIELSGDLTTAVLQGIDALRQSLAELRAGRSGELVAHDDLLAELAARLEAAEGGASSAALAEAAPPVPVEDKAWELDRWQPVLRVEVGKLDLLLGLVTRASVIQGQMGAALLQAQMPSDLAELHEKSERVLLELQDWVMDARMVPVSALFRSHGRTVRDVARSYGKRARLVIEGDNVRVDTGVADNVRDALTHLVRNAVDHGIEAPNVRLARGKQAEGAITLRARQRANQVVIEVSDDGAGFSETRMRARARALGRSDVDSLPAEALFRLAFEPGFSTAEQVSSVSGRGVGMDVVLRKVEALQGTVEIDSRPGVGTTIELRLPLTLSVIEGLWLRVADVDYIVPLDEVTECLELSAGHPARSEREDIIELRGEPVPLVPLRRVFGIAGPAPLVQRVIVVRYERASAGLVVDAIEGQRQTVIRPLGRLFRDVPGISGSTLRTDGKVALVLDVARLLRSVRRPQKERRSPGAPIEAAPEA